MTLSDDLALIEEAARRLSIGIGGCVLCELNITHGIASLYINEAMQLLEAAQSKLDQAATAIEDSMDAQPMPKQGYAVT